MRARGFRIVILNRSVISAGLLGLLLAVPEGARGDIYITNNGSNSIGAYTNSGASVSASFSGLSGPWGIAVSGSHIFVANNYNGTIGEYGTDGTTVNASLISGLNNRPYGIVVTPSAVPEPSSLVMMGFGSVALLAALHRRRGTA